MSQGQVDDFEKRLTAVHTRGLENVESPEMEDENQKEGRATDKAAARTPMPARGRAKSKRGLCRVFSLVLLFSSIFTVIIWV